MRKLRVLVCLPTRDNDFQLEQAWSVEQVAQTLNIELTLLYADNDSITQSSLILKAVQASADSRPDAVVFEPVGGDALPRVAQIAQDSGIGWAVLNRAPSYVPEFRIRSRVPVFSISSDHLEIGRIQGRQFAALLPAGGAVLYLEGPSNSSSAKLRTTGMLETKPSNIRVSFLRGQWTQESGERAVQSWLKLATSQGARINLVGAQDDSMAIGARKAFEAVLDYKLRAARLTIPFTGCDGVAKTGQAWVRKGLLAATVHIPPLAGEALEIMARAIQSGIQPPEHSTTVSVSIPPLNRLQPVALLNGSREFSQK